MADGSIVEHGVVGPIHVKFANRTAICSAVALQGNNEPLLGAIPLEEMPACRTSNTTINFPNADFIRLYDSGRDVLIHPRRQEPMVNPGHPYYAQLSMKR